MSNYVLPGDHTDGLPSVRPVRVGLLGCGTVGSAVARALLEDHDGLAQSVGAPVELAAVAVRYPEKRRGVDLPARLLTTDALAVAIDPEIDVVIEVIGGIEPAGTCIKAALADNKAVVTANKELLAGVGSELLDDPRADLFFEASVCGAIPVIRTLKESCAGDHIESFAGVFSGTCNFILSELTQRGGSLGEAVQRAQERGYAEADPTADLEGLDAAAKVAILGRMAFGVPVRTEHVRRRGITAVDPQELARRGDRGQVCKLIGGGRRVGTGVELWVGPEWVSANHPLAQVDGAANFVEIEASRAGRLTLQGQGAGGEPTASAVLGDLVCAARRRVRIRTPLPCVA